jgi:hypothetical protein
MAIVVMYNPTNSIAQETGYAGYGEARAGQNGDPYGVPEAVLANPTNAATERVQWYDADSSGGLLTGTVPVTLDVNLATGIDTWSVAGGTENPVTLSGGPTGQTIADVELAAGVQVGAKVSWSNVTIEFLQAGVVQETVNVGNGPSVDTRSSGLTSEQIEEIIPASSTDDEVIITGNIKMLAPDGTYPGPDDMFAQAYVFANA